MIIKDDNVEVKIQINSQHLIESKNVKVSSKFNNNLIFYDARKVHDCISESVEKQMETK